MIEVSVTDRSRIKPVEIGVRMLRAMYVRHRADWQWRQQSIDRLAGTDELRRAVEDGTVDALLAKWIEESSKWKEEARKYWLY